ncbi:serine hydrolase domain-containing protein [Psychroflexus salinarum]|uniref:Serine hydrolase domain-containing protein n=1 Tax=Psychroflexus salinarum TaxID=546024 RepID=A0ABW3GNF5_9FLAO
MKTLGRLLKWIISIIILIVIGLYLSGYGYIFKGIRVVYMTGHDTAFIDDYLYFDNRSIENGSPEPLPKHQNYNSAEVPQKLKDAHETYGTIGFLIFKDGKLWHEDYADGYGPKSHTNSFSMAKSITTLLLGKTIEEGFIESLDQKVIDFYPELKGEYADQMTVGDLASMASGLNWNEDYYSPFSITAQAYYDENLRDLILNLAVKEQPGQEFDYLSGNTQLLGMVIEKATGQELSNYLGEKFWKPMGMENNAYWQVDSEENGMEKTYCCISSNARDFARMGLLVLNKGKWNGKQLLNENFIEKCINPRFEEDPQYGYGFWLEESGGRPFFVMQGILGQYVIGDPQKNILIVRLGHERESKSSEQVFPSDFYKYLNGAYQMMREAS